MRKFLIVLAIASLGRVADASVYDGIVSRCEAETKRTIDAEALKKTGKVLTLEERTSAKIFFMTDTYETACYLREINALAEKNPKVICGPNEVYLDCSHRLAKGRLHLGRFTANQMAIWFAYFGQQAKKVDNPETLELQFLMRIAQVIEEMDLKRSALATWRPSQPKFKPDLIATRELEERVTADTVAKFRVHVTKSIARMEASARKRSTKRGVKPDPNAAWKKTTIAWLRDWEKRIQTKQWKFPEMK